MMIRGFSDSCRRSTGQPAHTNKIGINQIVLILHLICDGLRLGAGPDAALASAQDAAWGAGPDAESDAALDLDAGLSAYIQVSVPHIYECNEDNSNGNIRPKTLLDTDNTDIGNSMDTHCNSIIRRHRRTDIQTQ
jgi:hypothetical protein